MITQGPSAIDHRVSFLAAVPLLAGVPEEELRSIAQHVVPVGFAAGTVLMQEGDPADACYLIEQGEAGVISRDLTGQETMLSVLGPGQAVGEMALVQGGTRTATVRARSDVSALSLNRPSFEALVPSCPGFHRRLLQVTERRRIHAFLCKGSFFARLPEPAQWQVADMLQPEEAAEGAVILREGDPGDRFYLIKSGRVRVARQGHDLAFLGEGDFFGETALLADVPRTATIMALTHCELLVLSKTQFQAVVAEHATLRNQFSEMLRIRFRGAPGQSLLLPDPLSTVMPFLEPGQRSRYWRLLLGGTALFLLLTMLTILTRSPFFLYPTLAAGALTGPIVYISYLWSSKVLAERSSRLVANFVVAALISLPLAYWLEGLVNSSPGTFRGSLTIALIEESAKLLGVIWLLRFRSSRFVMDGVVYGAAAGMGFAALETAYFATMHLHTPDLMITTLWARSLLSPFGHGTWTAIASAGIWRGKAWRWDARSCGGLLLVVLLHTLWDWRPVPDRWMILWYLIVGSVGLMALRAIIQVATAEEARAVLALNPELTALTAPAAPAAPRLTCAACGTIAPAGSHYCPRCGQALKAPGASA